MNDVIDFLFNLAEIALLAFGVVLFIKFLGWLFDWLDDE